MRYYYYPLHAQTQGFQILYNSVLYLRFSESWASLFANYRRALRQEELSICPSPFANSFSGVTRLTMRYPADGKS